MASSRLNSLALLLALVALGASAQERARGVITAVSGDEISVANKKVRVGDKTELLFMQPIVLGDIKPGSFLAVTSQKGPGRELSLSYPGGSQKIVVPESAALFALVPGNRSQLVVGAPVNLTHDASGMALRVQVGPKK